MDRLVSPRGKLDWSRHKLDAINSDIRRFLSEHPYRFSREYDPQRGLDVLRFHVTGVPPLPQSVSHLIGEYATALRASLDHLIWALHVSRPKKPNKSQFPIFDDKIRFRNDSIAQLDGVKEDARIEIERLQPYHAPESHRHPLWRLHRLSNTDKHRIIVVVPRTLFIHHPEIPFGVYLSLHENMEKDPTIPLLPGFLGIPDPQTQFALKIGATLAIVLQNADADTGIFMEIRELPSLHDHVRNSVFPTLEGFVT